MTKSSTEACVPSPLDSHNQLALPKLVRDSRNWVSDFFFFSAELFTRDEDDVGWWRLPRASLSVTQVESAPLDQNLDKRDVSVYFHTRQTTMLSILYTHLIHPPPPQRVPPPPQPCASFAIISFVRSCFIVLVSHCQQLYSVRTRNLGPLVLMDLPRSH